VSNHQHVAGGYSALRQRDARGRFLPGITGNPHGARINRQKLQAKLAELRAVYDHGALSVMDLNRLELAAKHLIIASKTRDPNTSVRSTNAAERLLAKVEQRPVEKPKTLDELIASAR
jgi:hypothetical protein